MHNDNEVCVFSLALPAHLTLRNCTT